MLGYGSKKSQSYTTKTQVSFPTRITYLLLKLKQKPQWILVFLFARYASVRRFHRYLQLKNNNYFPKSSSLFSKLDVQEAVEALNRDGIFNKIALPQTILQEILDFAHSQPCYGGGETHLGFRIEAKKELDAAYSKPFFVARYYNVSSLSAIKKLSQDQKIKQIAAAYIGKNAKYTGASLYWTFPIADSSQDANLLSFCEYHYDLDDFASVRFCFYLTKVTEDSGSHYCIIGSHRKRRLLYDLNYLSRRPPEQGLKDFYGEDKIISITGKAGSGFIEDTFCYHRGSVPKSNPRLFLQLHFAANNYNHTGHHDYRSLSELKSFSQLQSN